MPSPHPWYELNPLTGKRRRKPKKNTSRKRRHESSTAKARMKARKARRIVVNSLLFSATAMHLAQCAFVIQKCKPFGTKEHRNWTHIFAATVAMVSVFSSLTVFAIQEEANLLDIPDNIIFNPTHLPLQHPCLDDIDEGLCIERTNYTPDQLCTLLQLFGFNGELIHIARKGTNNMYTFYPEELLIFMLHRWRDGRTIRAMSLDESYGGDNGRWGTGYRWLIMYLMDRYQHLLLPGSLKYWADSIPYFAQVVGEAAATDRPRHDLDRNLVEVIAGIPICPENFVVFSIVDCNETAICHPGSGPAFDGPHAPRKEHWDAKQRAVFGGHHRTHALKMLTVILPNGIEAALFGPVSVRRNDNQILTWSEVDEIMDEILEENDFDKDYSMYGDSILYGERRCVRTRHEPLAEGEQLPENLTYENKIMNKIRVPVEWNYASNQQLWKFSVRHEGKKLDADGELVAAEIRLMHLFTNIFTCFNGNEVSSFFDCDPPNMEDYLSLA